MTIKENEGMRVFQAHLPVSLYRRLTETSSKLNVSKSEVARNAIALFLENTKSKTVGNVGND